jgi:hypothetical protein
MLLRRTCCLLALAVLCLAGACRPAPGGQPVKYPAGWPVSEVTAPPDSYRTRLETMPVDYSNPLHHGCCIDGVMIGENRHYAVGFIYGGGWKQAVKHVEKCLDGIRCRVIRDSDEKHSSVREFDLVDHQVVIQLYRERIRRQDHYHLRAIVY